MTLSIELNNFACNLISQDSNEKAIEELSKALQIINQTKTCKLAIATSCQQHYSSEQQLSMSTSSLCHYYPTNNLDEGMNTFAQPVTLSYCDCMLHCDCRLMQATVLFNLGIAHSRRKEENKALSFYQKSFDKIYSSSSHTLLAPCELSSGISQIQRSMVNAILHNIGHSHFKLGNFENAILSYSHAIDAIATTCTPFDCRYALEMSSAMNCLAVAKYHRVVHTESTITKVVETKSIIQTFFEALQWARCNTRESATIINNLARAKFFCEEYKEALALYKEACMIRVLNIGERHMDVAACRFNIGKAEETLGEVPKAIESYRGFLSVALSQVGLDHPDVSNVMLNVGQLYYDLRNLQEARNFLSQAVKCAILSHGPKHLMVATANNKLGNVHYDQCEFDLALDAYKTGLAIERLHYPTCDENITITLLNIARVLEQKQENKEALEIYTEVLSSKRQKQDEEGASNVLAKIGSLYDLLGEYTLASRAFQEAANIQRTSETCQKSLLPTILNALGIALYKEGLFNSALSSFAEAIEIYNSSNDSCPTDILRIYSNTATVYKCIGDTKNALQFYKKALQLEHSSFIQGVEYVTEIASLHHQIGMLLKESGDTQEACQFLKNSFQLCMEHPNTICRAQAFRIVKDLGDLYVLLRDIQAAVETYSVALTRFHPSDADTNGEEITIELPIDAYLLLSRKSSPAAAAA